MGKICFRLGKTEFWSHCKFCAHCIIFSLRKDPENPVKILRILRFYMAVAALHITDIDSGEVEGTEGLMPFNVFWRYQFSRVSPIILDVVKTNICKLLFYYSFGKICRHRKNFLKSFSYIIEAFNWNVRKGIKDGPANSIWLYRVFASFSVTKNTCKVVLNGCEIYWNHARENKYP